MTDDNLIDNLSGMTPRQVNDFLNAIAHRRREQAEADGTEALAALFADRDRPTQAMLTDLDNYAQEK